MNLVDHLGQQTARMLDMLEHLVSIESPTSDVPAVTTMARAVDDMAGGILGAEAQWVEAGDRPHLLWRFGGRPTVVLIGHLDTVWPKGTLARWPFTVDGGQATGPGAFDMKAGIVQGLLALSALDDLDGVTLLLNSDEETGSLTSRQLVEDTARGAGAVLVLEPSARGALKIARKGVSLYELDVHGRAAHAGLEPEKGANAVVELAHRILSISDIARPDLGTTVTPTVASAGTTINTVPAFATVHLDVRVSSPEEQRRVHDELCALVASTPGTRVDLSGGPNRPPFPETSSASLFALATETAGALGIGALAGAAVGGGSDGNFTAGIGIPTLDGLGAVGDNAHAEGEYVEVAAMSHRAALVASLVDSLRGR